MASEKGWFAENRKQRNIPFNYFLWQSPQIPDFYTTAAGKVKQPHF